MKEKDLMFGRVYELVVVQKKSQRRAAVLLKIPQKRVSRLLKLIKQPEATPARKPRTIDTIEFRRKQVKKLANMRKMVDGQQFPVYATAAAIARQLWKEFKIRITKWSVRRDLGVVGLNCYVRRSEPCRDPVNVRKKLIFCRQQLRKNKKYHDSIIWSDESGVSSNDHTSRTMYAASVHAVCGRETMRIQNALNLQVWAAMGKNWRSELVLFPDGKILDPETGEKKAYRLNAQKYKYKCLMPNIHVIAKRTKLFQQDGATPHKGVAMSYMRNKGVKRLIWPAYAPDLAPIENCWPLLNRLIAAMHPRTMAELKLCAVKAWKSIPVKTMNKFAGSFRNKCERYVAKHGKK